MADKAGEQPIGKSESRLSTAFRAMRGAFIVAGVFSLAINLLMLTGPLFMLQVYDRVLASGSVPTLIALFGLVVCLYAFMGLFDYLRTRILSRIGYWLDQNLGALTFRNWIFQSLVSHQRLGRPLTDLATLRTFLGSTALPAVFDLPWSPIYLGIVFFLHIQLGLLALAGAAVVIIIALINEIITRGPSAEGARLELQEAQVVDDCSRTAEAIVAMGMTGNLVAHWSDMRGTAVARSQHATERGEGLASISKAFRLLLQSAILGLGAYLAINHEISAGTIIAASIIAGRALAPIDQIIGNWRNILRVRQCYKRLSTHLGLATVQSPPISLPRPEGRIIVDKVVKFLPTHEKNPTARKPILQGISFSLQPGDGLGVIGPSASGKSSLARILVGLWSADQGSLRIDGATHDQWDADALGRHIGYLPQTVELIAGTIRQNIARFDFEATDEEVVAAAKLAGVHEIILKLPEGYSTAIGSGRPALSGGQAQRIALARAVFRAPRLIVLDEPNSNLDVDGDTALTNAIKHMRSIGSTVVVMTHRPSAIAAVDLILMLKEGRQAEFGEKAEVLRKVTKVA